MNKNIIIKCLNVQLKEIIPTTKLSITYNTQMFISQLKRTIVETNGHSAI